MENNKRKVVVTGAGGFVGKRFMEYAKDRFELVPVSLLEKKVRELDLKGVDAIVHLAGKAHQMQPIPEKEYYDINYTLTKELAEKAVADGVPHFIYISSTKVYGDAIKERVDEKSPCNPDDPYGKSKYQSEELLRYMSTALFKVAVIRPPLVYGPEVKGNMIRLLELAEKNLPLPFGKAGNARSMVFVDNLAALIGHVVETKASGTFIAGDAEPLATDRLITLMRTKMGRKADLVTVPGLFRGFLKFFRPALYTRLFGSFVVDNTNTNQVLQFTPPYSTEAGIEEMVNWYKQLKK